MQREAAYTDTAEPPRARPGPSRPSLASGGPPAAARCGGVTNPTTEHRDAVGRSEAQVGECIAHPGLSPGPINRRLRHRAQELVFTRSKCVPERVKQKNSTNTSPSHSRLARTSTTKGTADNGPCLKNFTRKALALRKRTIKKPYQAISAKI